MPAYKSPMHEMAETTPTQFWNDNCSISDLKYALEHGAVGATTNPVIVGQVLDAELDNYLPVIRKLIADNPNGTEDEVAWLLNEHMALEGAKLLEPVFKATGGKAGYISIQTNAKYYRSAEKMADQAEHFSTLAPNMMVKMPVTAAGVKAVEESTYRGVNVNATVSFTVPQAVAVAEAVERGLARREAEGKDNSGMHPVCTIMVGRIEDWLRDVQKAENIAADEEALTMAGVAVFKRAYQEYNKKGYRTRLLAAAYRSEHHWLDFIGGNVSLTIPPKWIHKFVDSGLPVVNKMDEPVNPALMAQLDKFTDFRRAYEPDGMAEVEFDMFGATRKTLMQFLGGYDKMVAVVRNIMVNG